MILAGEAIILTLDEAAAIAHLFKESPDRNHRVVLLLRAVLSKAKALESKGCGCV